jgi:DNA-binding MarR family transcriptional regulator
MQPVRTQKKAEHLEAIEGRRGRNMRQLLLRSSRIVNRHVVKGLNDRGYTNLRSTHTTLLSNIDLAGSTVTDAAERAGISKQAMGRLATELQSAGYIAIRNDLDDARVRILQLTDAGHRLMLDSLEIMEDLERRYARIIGKERFSSALRVLDAFVNHIEAR